MTSVATHFTALDWSVLVAYMLLTTWVGHALRGKQATIKDFFLAGRRLPWPAVCGSIIATEISALTFVGVPGMVFAAGGNFTYLQWAIGSIIARFIVGVYFVKVYYREGIYSPYDYMQERLGPGARTLTTWLFFLSAILGQSVRLLVTALILRTVTGLDFRLCICLIGLFAILWTWIGGMTTVIWTDVIQFAIFLISATAALTWLIVLINGNLPEVFHTASQAGKLRLIDLSTDPDIQFTLWVGLLAMPFQNLAAFGTDQLNAQRMFCCRSPKDASKAIIFSSLSQIVTVLMLCIGAALYVYYQQHLPTVGERMLFSESADYVFPVWITTALPPGLSGLVLAGAFAAAISSLDSVLAALAQTSLALWRNRQKHVFADDNHRKLLFQSRLAVGCWGIVLVFCAVGLQSIRAHVNLISLAFGMVAYTYGPLLGAFLLALLPIRRDIRGIWIGTFLSILLTLYVRPDLYNILAAFHWISPEQAAALRPQISFAWLYPITCSLTLGCGILFGRRLDETMPLHTAETPSRELETY